MSEFHNKHIGPNSSEIKEMLSSLKCNSLDELLEKIVPNKILDIDDNSIGNEHFSENDILNYIKKIGSQNQVFRGDFGTIRITFSIFEPEPSPSTHKNCIY